MQTGVIIRRLKRQYSKTIFISKNHKEGAFYVLISCILSQRTKDEVTYPAAKRLFMLANNPKAMLKLPLKTIEKAIYPSGFYITKAKRIKEVSKYLLKNHNGTVPNTYENLLRIKGVGRKTAGIVLTHAFQIPALPIDTHCHRIANRIGWARTKTPDETEFALMKVIPKKEWLELNELLVKHGQSICKPISPFCSRCIIGKYCRKTGVKKSR
ncbi:MAG: endonuclease III [Candidatus Nanoarchaeia archaeon]|nr:endonuclease III [Candidatus Nanoarchaeia archaeon]